MLTTIERRLDQVFLIRRQGGAVIETWPLGLTFLHVLQRVAGRSRSYGARLGSGTVTGRAARAYTCRLHSSGIAATHLVYVLRKPSVWDDDANFLQPCPHVLQAMTGSQEITDFRPCLANLAGLGPRLFLRLRAESSEIEFVGRFPRHSTILRAFTESFQEVSSKFPI